MEQILAQLRAAGWSVAIHNDYKMNGLRRTFWLFTHGSGTWIKGESTSDLIALRMCLQSAKYLPITRGGIRE